MISRRQLSPAVLFTAALMVEINYIGIRTRELSGSNFDTVALSLSTLR